MDLIWRGHLGNTAVLIEDKMCGYVSDKRKRTACHFSTEKHITAISDIPYLYTPYQSFKFIF
jgi:hypothetical protein